MTTDHPTKATKSLREEICDLLVQSGIDPNEVCDTGMDESGYDAFVIDPATGRRLFARKDSRNTFEHERRTWPENAPVDKILELAAILA